MPVKHYVPSVDVVLEIPLVPLSIILLDVVLLAKIVDNSRIRIWFATREVFSALMTRFVVRMEAPVSRIKELRGVVPKDRNVLGRL
jgi:hypothetical protein